jgi:hypothetical protein
MKNIIKRRLFLGLFLITAIMATIKGSVHAYNVLSFAIPVLFIGTLFILFSGKARRKCIETFKARTDTSAINTIESCVWNLSIVFLLAAFGHWFLGLLWLISWLTLLEVGKDAMKEKNKEEGGEV